MLISSMRFCADCRHGAGTMDFKENGVCYSCYGQFWGEHPKPNFEPKEPEASNENQQ